MGFVDDWFEIAHPFLYDSDLIRKSIKDIPVDERRVKAIEAWIQLYDMPSWEEVAMVIEDLFPAHEVVAKRLRKTYLPDIQPVYYMKDELRKSSFEILKHEKDMFISIIHTAKLKELNENSAFEETSDISDWFALGWFLGIPEDELLAIEKECSRTDSKRQAVLKLWLELKEKEATWLVLGKAIKKMRSHVGLASKIIKRACELGRYLVLYLPL